MAWVCGNHINRDDKMESRGRRGVGKGERDKERMEGKEG